MHKKPAANRKFYTCAQTHTYTTISRSHSRCYQVTLRHYTWFSLSQYFNSHLGRKYCVWNNTLGLGDKYFSTGESDSIWNTNSPHFVQAFSDKTSFALLREVRNPNVQELAGLPLAKLRCSATRRWFRHRGRWVPTTATPRHTQRLRAEHWEGSAAEPNLEQS